MALRLLRGSLGAMSAFWLILGIGAAVSYGPRMAATTSLASLIVLLMFGNAAILFGLYRKLNSPTRPWVAVAGAWAAVNLVLSFTDEFGALDLASAVLSLGAVGGAAAAAFRRSGGVMVALVAVCLSACGPQIESGPAAEVGAWTLSQGQLADLLVLAQPLPLDSTTVASLVDEWVSMAAFSQKIAAGADPLGPEATEASLWLETREAVLDAERRSRLGSTAAIDEEQAADVFQADSLRLLAHVLLRTSPVTSGAERDLQRRTAQEILDGLLAGGSWSAAVARSEDLETRDASGLLGLFTRNEVTDRLRDAAWALQPGQVSSVLASSQGFHILYRPTLQDVAPLFARLLSERRTAEAEADARASLLETLDITVAADGIAEVRSLAASYGEQAPSIDVVASWSGGTLPQDVVAHYVAALPRDARAGLTRADDQAVGDFIRDLALREARIQQARNQGVAPDAETLKELTALHRDDVAYWQASLTEGGAPYTRPSLDRYMERLVARQVELRPVPPLLRAWLLQGLPWSVNADAQGVAAEAARRLIASAAGG